MRTAAQQRKTPPPWRGPGASDCSSTSKHSSPASQTLTSPLSQRRLCRRRRPREEGESLGRLDRQDDHPNDSPSHPPPFRPHLSPTLPPLLLLRPSPIRLRRFHLFPLFHRCFRRRRRRQRHLHRTWTRAYGKDDLSRIRLRAIRAADGRGEVLGGMGCEWRDPEERVQGA